jgi:PGF-pre-PGF domain-containing protein
MRVEEVTFSFERAVENRWVKITEFTPQEGPPENLPPLQVRALLYFQLSTDFKQEEVRSTTIEFRVSKLWLEREDDRDRVRLYHWDNESWKELPTRFIDEDLGNLYFSASIKEFSTYAIGLLPAPTGISGIYAFLLVALVSVGIYLANHALRWLRRPRPVEITRRPAKPKRREVEEEEESPIVEVYRELLQSAAERFAAERAKIERGARALKPLRKKASESTKPAKENRR